jgi:hypothetical protein
MVCFSVCIYNVCQWGKVQVDLYYMVCVSGVCECVCVHMGLMLSCSLSYCQPHYTVSLTCIGTVCMHVEVRGITSQPVLFFHHVHFKDCTQDLRLAIRYPYVLSHVADPSTSLSLWLSLSLKLEHVCRHCVCPASPSDPPVSASPGHFVTIFYRASGH